MLTREFSGWNKLELTDVVFAYRKAKADVFYERSIPGMTLRFIKFERNLLDNLNRLLEVLKRTDARRGSSKNDEGKTRKEWFETGSLTDHGEADWGDDPSNLFGEPIVIPKKTKTKLTKKAAKRKMTAQFAASDPDQIARHVLDTFELEPAFRLTSAFPVETHVISALWVNMIGHKLDAKLGRSAYGTRVRRLRGEEELPAGDRPYHITAPGIFAPYWNYYRRWRDEGLKAIRRLLNENRNVAAFNLDIRSYYHNIDPNFLIDDEFIEKHFGIVFSEEEKEFNKAIASFFHNWAAGMRTYLGLKDIPIGIPIGIAAARLLANVLLAPWDRHVEDRLRPAFYGRYVDDMILVMPVSERIRDADTAWNCLRKALDNVLEEVGGEDRNGTGENKGLWRIRLDRVPELDDPCPEEAGKEETGEEGPETARDKGGRPPVREWVRNTRIVLQQGKQRIFLLEGEAGVDLLDVIEQEIAQFSSEFRLMPSVEELGRAKTAQVLVAHGEAGEQPDRLGHVGTTTVRRLGWALTLRKAETLARDLPKTQWRRERSNFYAFSRRHILRPDRLLDYFGHLSRLFGLAIMLEDLDEFDKMLCQTGTVLQMLKKKHIDIEINGLTIYKPRVKNKNIKDDIQQKIFHNLSKTIHSLIIETIFRNSANIIVTNQSRKNNIVNEVHNAIKNINKTFGSYKNIEISELTVGDLIKKLEIKNENELRKTALEVMCADLSATPLCQFIGNMYYLLTYSDFINGQSTEQTGSHLAPLVVDATDDKFAKALKKRGIKLDLIEEFLKILFSVESGAALPADTSGNERDPITDLRVMIPTGLVFPTRPFSVSDVAEILMRHNLALLGKPARPGVGGERSEAHGSTGKAANAKQLEADRGEESAAPASGTQGWVGPVTLHKWGEYVRALRGIWIRPQNPEAEMIEERGERLLYVPVGTRERKKVILGLTNVRTSHKAWEHAASGRPLVTAERYRQITRVVNQALQCHPRPDYLLFHELCLPRRWVRTIRERLGASRISLIAGVEYDILHRNSAQTESRAVNEVHLALIDNRLGHDFCLPLWQQKLEPAIDESSKLRNRFGLLWHAPVRRRIVYNHDDFFFGVLICSELLNSQDRILFQGKVDALIVPSWNQDLATFSSLIKAAALDIHCYAALVNNSEYGDSRVRVPAKDRHKRDRARLRGGINDYLVCVELDIDLIKRFQSRAQRFAESDDRFKPVPEGFVILDERRRLPPR